MARFRRQRHNDEESEVNVTPMLDVVFIMLIFFIVTASFVKESGIDVTRPDAATAERKQRASILIAISKNNEIWIQKRRIDVRAVRANVERLLADMARHFGGRATRPPAQLLAALDVALDAVAIEPQRSAHRAALLGLVGIRRGLFPEAPAYRGGLTASHQTTAIAA